MPPLFFPTGPFTVAEAALLIGHVVLFLATLRIAATSLRAYRRTGDRLHGGLAAAFLLLVLALSFDDFSREVLGAGRLLTEALELVPALVAMGLIYYTLYYD